MYTVYILHFDRPILNRARHYVGYTERELAVRLAEHQTGKGSRLVKYLVEHGGSFKVAHFEVFEDRVSARNRELELKAERNLKSHCMYCTVIK